MSTTYSNVRLSEVDGNGNVNVLYPESNAGQISISSSNNNLLTNYTTLQALADALASSAFTVPTSVAEASKAVQLKTTRYIDGIEFNGTRSVNHYATCSTAADSVAKVAVLQSSSGVFNLTTGSSVRVKFTYANTATGTLSLQVNYYNDSGTVVTGTAKSIMEYGSTAKSASTTPNWKAGDVVDFVYDGSNWIMMPSEGQIAALNSDLQSLTSNFNTALTNLYNTCVSKGSTPSAQTISAIVTAVSNIATRTVHTNTYTPAVNTSANDMGSDHEYRYVDTSGMITPSGTLSKSYTSNGTETVNVKNYANISITRNIQTGIEFPYDVVFATEMTGINIEEVVNDIIDKMGSIDYTDYLNEPHILKYLYDQGYFKASDLSGRTTTFAGCTDETFMLMVALANVGVINLSTYWSVGNERNVSISAITGHGTSGNNNAIPSQSAVTMPMVLANAGGKKLATATAGGRTNCEFVILSKKMLNTYAAMQNVNNSTTVKCYGNNYGGWACSAIRGYYNTYIFNALPEYLQKALKPHKSIRGKGGGSNTSGTITTIDKLGMPAERNVFASKTYSQQDEWNALAADGEVQWTYYQTANNRKHYTVSGTSNACWLSSPRYSNASGFCTVYTDGTAGNTSAHNAYGLAFFGCL